MGLRDRLQAARIVWRNYVAGYRLGRAESLRDGALEQLKTARERYDQARIAVVEAEAARIRALMETGMTYQQACVVLDIPPSLAGEVLVYPEVHEAVTRAFTSAFFEDDEDRNETKAGRGP
jgi:hypothetical protein